MLAAAWGGLEPGAHSPRRQAQHWLQAEGYRPARFDFDFPPPRWLTGLLPLLQHDDHPAEDLDNMRLQVSLPVSIEGFVRARHPRGASGSSCAAAATGS